MIPRLLLPLVLVLALLGALPSAGAVAAEPSLSAWAILDECGDEAVAGHLLPSVDAMPWCGATGPEDVGGPAVAGPLPLGRQAAVAGLAVLGMAPHPPGPRFPTGPPVLI